MSVEAFSLSGKTAVVTGAGRGLGKAMALGLASCGANVFVGARTSSGPAAGMVQADWSRVVAVGLTGYFNVAQAAGEQMIRQGKGGSIIAVSANSSVVGYAELTAAAAAKGGVDQMCRNLAVEWGEYGIRVNSINPGYTEHVPGYGDVSPGAGSTIEEGVRLMTPLGRRGRVSEFVWPVVFLASDAASYITGVSLMVDGGYVVK
jgi:gluconate 5-dehydrogenase